jgi:hypothetical protein
MGLWLLVCLLVGGLSLVSWVLACFEGENATRRIADGSLASKICHAYRAVVDLGLPIGWVLVAWPATVSVLLGLALFLRERFTWWAVSVPLILWLGWTLFVVLVRSTGSVAT